MRPTQIDALPALYTETWHDIHNRTLDRIFGIYEVEESLAAEGDPELVLVERLRCRSDAHQTVSSIRFDGKLVGIYCNAGERGDHSEFYLYDQEAYLKAYAFLRSKQPLENRDRIDVADDRDLPEMSSFNGAEAIEHDGRTIFVKRTDIGDNGALVFDDAAYSEAFDRLVRPEFEDTEAREKGLADPRMRSLVADAMLEGVVDGLRVQRVDDMEQDVPNPSWIGVVAATDEGTYAVRVSNYYFGHGHFAWSAGRWTVRLGGPELFDDYAARYGEAAAPSP